MHVLRIMPIDIELLICYGSVSNVPAPARQDGGRQQFFRYVQAPSKQLSTWRRNMWKGMVQLASLKEHF